MATNFFSRWSQRKLDESTDKAREAEQPLEETSVTSPESASQTPTSAEELAPNDPAPIEPTNALGESGDTKESASEATEELSMAQLLVSEASESVKKAALRKLFLSEEFNVRDGLDDYDDDYSNLKSLSEGVAESLRDWVKEKAEEETSSEQEQVTENKEEVSVSNAEDAESDLVESDEITGQQKELYKNTVPVGFDTDAIENDPKEVGQNIPHKE
ncbi:DUF3306 domain-containing protein [Vibrio sp. 070316B]|uniref:DUF3306 domain-containing protein n=1 Tax=unclassified Vibrio TaxID=2614977 RepID=UPI00149398E5|nr:MULTISPECIES: DUF3306 domain-containing protein [unclassified Vibrio]CAH6884676.1 conserved hypothetical protein [Vibrio chagasii]NOI39484.1 DUF3306 domain-containing protein [Vibrio sp. 070316B]NOI84969.1 DUF3306 domain-containing protein [Vibrio sp. 99K-1]CAH6922310.1 conserved hypothetical protein [Vibrio chagasii]CAH6947382.1 conserved hypothetical protein [Vibrio chagasii]